MPYTKLGEYKKLDSVGYVKESGFDKNMPFVNLPTKSGGNFGKGIGDYYYQIINPGYRIILVGGYWADSSAAGLNYIHLSWSSSQSGRDVGSRILKTPL